MHNASRAKTNCSLLDKLRGIVGTQYSLTDPAVTHRYGTGVRFSLGNALTVVRPGTLVEQWRVLRVRIAANVVVVMQASNTGLIG
jgi:D-lactate dehydrogenase